MISYKDLDTRAKINCMDQYVNIICPYADDLDNAGIEEIEESIGYWLGDQFSIDKAGNWYDEGRRINDYERY